MDSAIDFAKGISQMTITEEYNAARLVTSDLLAKLNEGLARHMERQGQNHEHWGFVGDLNHINRRLEDILWSLPAKG